MILFVLQQSDEDTFTGFPLAEGTKDRLGWSRAWVHDGHMACLSFVLKWFLLKCQVCPVLGHDRNKNAVNECPEEFQLLDDPSLQRSNNNNEGKTQQTWYTSSFKLRISLSSAERDLCMVTCWRWDKSTEWGQRPLPCRRRFLSVLLDLSECRTLRSVPCPTPALWRKRNRKVALEHG